MFSTADDIFEVVKNLFKKKVKPTPISKKETSHEEWIEGYWKWRKTQDDYKMANKIKSKNQWFRLS